MSDVTLDPGDDVLLGYRDLRALGIKWTPKHLRTLQRAGRFPAAIKVGANTNAWWRREVRQYLASRPRVGVPVDEVGEAGTAAARRRTSPPGNRARAARA
jgi:hypothetical protein